MRLPEHLGEALSNLGWVNLGELRDQVLRLTPFQRGRATEKRLVELLQALRHPKNGGHIVNRRRRTQAGEWEYAVTAPVASTNAEPLSVAEQTFEVWPPEGLVPYYADASIALYHGDCRAILPKLAAWDHVITDPPYDERVHTRHRVGFRQSIAGKKKEIRFEHLTPEVRWALAHHFTRTRRWCLVFSDIDYSAAFWQRDLEAHGLRHLRTVFWEKLHANPQRTGDRPAAWLEAILLHHSSEWGIPLSWNGGGRGNVFRGRRKTGESYEAIFGGAVGNAIQERIVRGEARWGHDTPKPLSVCLELVTLFTEPGEVVLDPFAGSGTTGVAARRLGRRAILIEKKREHCDQIVARLKLDAAA